MPEAVLVSAVRTPVGRAPKGALSTTRPDDLAATAMSGALDRGSRPRQIRRSRRRDPRLRPARGRAGLEHRPLAALRAGFRSRFPASPSTAFAPPASKPSPGRSAHPLRRRPRGHRRRSGDHEPASHWRPQAQPQSLAGRALSRVAAHHGPHRRARRPPLLISREDQDAFALASHQKASPRRPPDASPMS
jgi:acetyl-CoA acyltransferase